MTVPTTTDLIASLAAYPSSLQTRAVASPKSSSNLVQLDAWFRTELRPSVSTPGKERGLTTSELGKLMEWKLARGKWRPKLIELALSNPSPLVTSLTLLCSSSSSSLSIEEIMTSLCKLKGIGPATASAILSLYKPTEEPFMSDEAFQWVASDLGKCDYSVKAWKRFREVMKVKLVEKGCEGCNNMEEFEMALWSWGVRKKFGVEPKGEEEEIEEGKGKGKGKKVVNNKKKRKVEEKEEEEEEEATSGIGRGKRNKSKGGK